MNMVLLSIASILLITSCHIVISSHDSTSSKSQDNHFSVSSDFLFNTFTTLLDSNTMLCLATNAQDSKHDKSERKQYKKMISRQYNQLVQHHVKPFINHPINNGKTVPTKKKLLHHPTDTFKTRQSEITQEHDSVYVDPLIDKEEESTRFFLPKFRKHRTLYHITYIISYM